MQEYQAKNLNNPDVMQLDRTIPLRYEEFTPEEEEYVTQYLCNHTRFYYHESLYKDYIGTIPYELNYYYDWECSIMPWASDKIRLYYNAGLRNRRMIGKELDSRAMPAEVGREAEAKNTQLKQVENFNFSQATDFKGELVLKYDEVELKGLETFVIIYYTSVANDTEKYDNWTFSTSALWDDFWFAPVN